MPSYRWLLRNKLDPIDVKARLKALKQLGVPYSTEELENSDSLLKQQAGQIAANLKEQGQIEGVEDREIVAMIAYLQRLGRDAVDHMKAGEH